MAEPSSRIDHENQPLFSEGNTDAMSAKGQRKVFNKLTRGVVLLCAGIAFVSCVDRSNVGYAANDLCSDLRLTHAEYGTAISIFYVGYVVAQPTSNVMLRRFGAPAWLAFIVFAWGCVATALAFIQSLWHFYLLRVLLGLAEGGTFPGIFYYLGLFFPDAYIEQAYAVVIGCAAFSTPLSSPIAVGLLSSDGIYGTRGWRNLFFVEGLVPIVFSVILFFFLPKSLETASFLNSEEKEWLTNQKSSQGESSKSNLIRESWEISKSLRFWLFTYGAGTTSGVSAVLYYWITLIIQDGLNEGRDDSPGTCSSGGNSVVAVALTAIPYTLGGLVCVAIRTKTHYIRNRTAFSATVFTICSVLLLSWVWTREISFVFGFISFTAAISIWGSAGVFVIGTVSTIFRPELRSTALALNNGLGSLASFVLPIIVGHIVDAYGFRYAIPFSAFMLLTASISVFVVKDPMLAVKRTGNRI